MRAFFTIIACCVAFTSMAQTEVYWYQADDQNLYVAKGCVPDTDIDWYSQPDGGRIILSGTADAQGDIIYAAPDTIQPAFMLQTDLVTHLQEAEFRIKDRELLTVSGANTINFSAAVQNSSNTAFRIVKLATGVPPTGASMPLSIVR
jgi:hypothetical protein